MCQIWREKREGVGGGIPYPSSSAGDSARSKSRQPIQSQHDLASLHYTELSSDLNQKNLAARGT
jgi:hypothetical protein